jgi:hypothetical protein
MPNLPKTGSTGKPPRLILLRAVAQRGSGWTNSEQNPSPASGRSPPARSFIIEVASSLTHTVSARSYQPGGARGRETARRAAGQPADDTAAAPASMAYPCFPARSRRLWRASRFRAAFRRDSSKWDPIDMHCKVR